MSDKVKPVEIPSDWEPTHGYYLTYKNGIAVISDGSPQLGHKPVTVLSVERVKGQKAANRWFKQELETKPWIRRH